jgi:hypothetical protein
MQYVNTKETLSFLALALFFSGGILWFKEFITISSTWDYIVLQLLTMMNGLGLFMVLVLLARWIRDRKAEAQEGLPIKLSKGSKSK